MPRGRQAGVNYASIAERAKKQLAKRQCQRCLHPMAAGRCSNTACTSHIVGLPPGMKYKNGEIISRRIRWEDLR